MDLATTPMTKRQCKYRENYRALGGLTLTYPSNTGAPARSNRRGPTLETSGGISTQ